MFADISALAEEFSERASAAFTALSAAHAELEKARERHRDIDDRRQAMKVEESLVGLEAAVRNVETRVAVVEAARTSRANRSKEISDAETALAVLRHRLGVDPETDLEPRMPTSDAISAVRTLAAASMSRYTKNAAAAEILERATTSVEVIKARLASLIANRRDSPFGMTAAEFASLATEASATDQKRSKATSLEQDLRQRLSALGFEDADALRAVPFPPDQLIHSEIEQRNAVTAELNRQVSLRASAQAQRDGARAEQARLRAEGVIATPEVLSEVRRRRDEAWEPIRAAHAATVQALPQAERQVQLTVFVAALAEADRVADARVTEAQRVAALIETERRITDAEVAIEAAAAAEQHLAASLAERTAAFTRAYPQSCEIVPELPSLLALSTSRAEALTTAAAAREARLEADQAVQQLTPRLRLLVVAEEKAGLAPSGKDDLVKRVQALTEAISAHDRAHADYEREKLALADQETRLAAARRTLSVLDREEEAWAAEWALALPSIGVPPSTPPADADDLAIRWDSARGELRAIAQTRRRIARMDEDEADLAAQIEAVKGSISFALPDDPVAAGKMLADRWRTNDGIRLRKEALTPDLEASANALVSSERAVENRKETVERLRAEAGGGLDDTAMQDAAKRRQELSDAQGHRTRLIDAARTAGDGLDIASLRANADGQDLDVVRAEIEDVRNRIEAADREIEEAIRLEQQASTAVAAHEAPSAIGLAAVEREGAVVDMHAALERYVELKLARGLMDRAVQQVRGEQQDPLVKEAGRLFAHMTRGEFDGVAADVDAKGAPVVVGLRSGTGAHQPVATMSDGTRDQLFLAFRLASLANYSAAAEPLPFVADDILVHFDDDRGVATLDLLADFAASTQVLLFTHHRSVLSAAERLAADSRASIADFRPN